MWKIHAKDMNQTRQTHRRYRCHFLTWSIILTRTGHEVNWWGCDFDGSYHFVKWAWLGNKIRMSLYQKPDLMPSMVTPTLMHVLQYICKTSNLLQCILGLLWWWCFMFLLGLLRYKESVHMKMWYSLWQFYFFSAIVYKDSRVPHGVVLFHPFFLEILSHKE